MTKITLPMSEIENKDRLNLITIKHAYCMQNMSKAIKNT